MKKIVLILIAIIGTIFSFAQNPVLHWKFDNAQIIYQGGQYALQFDIVISCSEPATYASDLMLYFKYDTTAFGANIVANGGLTYQKLTLLQASVWGSLVYNLYGPSGSDTAVGFMVEMNLGPPPLGYDVPLYPLYIGLIRIQMKIQDTTQSAGIKFCENIMNGTQYFVDTTHPTPTKYGVPPDYAGIYDNDLMNFSLVNQTPILHWRFANPQIIQGQVFQFDVEASCSQAGTFHSDLQLWFVYNTAAFGENIVLNNNINYERLELLQGDLSGTPLYGIFGHIDSSPYRYCILSEATFTSPVPMFMNEVPEFPEFKGYLRFQIVIQDPAQLAGLEFYTDFMNGDQYYLDATHPSQTKYGLPPGFECIYHNDLMNYPLNSLYDLQLKVYLEGPYSGNGMYTALLNDGLIPCQQPYSSAPWNYSGTEGVASVPAGVVDWLLIELRDAQIAASAGALTRINRYAAFLLDDGSVARLNGTPGIQFNTPVQENLFAVVWHRNHLPVMSAVPLVLNGNTYTYDFTIGAGQAYGGSQAHKDLGDGSFGMWSGDGSGDGFINNNDKLDVWNVQAGGHNYLPGDFNLDTRVNNMDKNDIWIFNGGHSSQVPE